MARDLTFDLSPTQSAFVHSNAQVCILHGPMGEGKCLAKGTRVVMFDGSLRCVEDIRPGDCLMGDDSTPRTVLALGKGTGPLFRVVPYKGEPFTCNAEHILSLRRTCTRNSKRGKPFVDRLANTVEDIPLNKFVEMSRYARNIRKLYRVPVEFSAAPVEIDPYFLGLWLGDGNAHNTGVTTADKDVVFFLESYADKLGMRVRKSDQAGNRSSTYTITIGNTGNHENKLFLMLKKHNLLHNKHIPLRYLANSRAVRLSLFAGLVDSDGYVNRNSYQFTLKSHQLAEDLAYLVRSLGFAAHVNRVKKSIRSTGFAGEYHQVGVSGDLSGIPAVLDRRRCAPRKPFKDVLSSGIKGIVAEGVGEFFGFVLDGNHRFLLSDFTVTHNTFAGSAGVTRHAQRCGMDIRAAIVRDTHQNLKISTVPSLQEIFGAYVTFHDDCKKMVIHSTPRVDCDLFGIDDPASLSKLQGPEYAIIWLEEPAPILEKANAGLPRDVFDMALARAARQRGTLMRVQITQNPSEEEHWTEELAQGPEILEEDPETGLKIVKAVFRIPYGENTKLNPLARVANKAAFKGDPGKYARYVGGIAAPVKKGRQVAPEYNPAIHYAGRELEVVAGAPGVRFWDGWHHPVCLVGQQITAQRLWIHACLYGDGVGVKELIEQQLSPLLAERKYLGKITRWRDIGDPTLRTPDQSTTNQSGARRIEQLLKTRFEPGPTRWAYRIQPLATALSTLGPNGNPLIQVSSSAYDLHKALNGGWHWKIDNSGRRLGALPVQGDKYGDIGNALCYGVAQIYPFRRLAPEAERYKQRGGAVDPRRLAMSYASSLPGAGAGAGRGVVLNPGMR